MSVVGSLLLEVQRPDAFVQSERTKRLLASVTDIYTPGCREDIPIRERITASDLIGQSGDSRLDKTHWIRINGGEFLIGAQANNPNMPNYDQTAGPNEGPVHTVRVEEFDASKLLVTVQEYPQFVDQGGYRKQDYWDPQCFGTFDCPKNWHGQLRFPNRPVVGVSWYEAAAYCAFANARLPSEAEWEVMARGHRRKFPWGDDGPTLTHSNHGGLIGHTTGVGLFPRGDCPEGVSDLVGNVWEWCADWATKYGEPPTISTKQKILRGGSWYERPPGSVRVSFRGVNEPASRFSLVGFRIARSVESR